MTIIQNARTSGGGYVAGVPTQALSVGPVETWQAEKVSIWHAGNHDNPFGQRLTTLMISQRLADTAVPMWKVEDVAAAVERVRAAGGTATDPERQPYGTTSQCADDQGVRFYLGDA